MNAETTGRAHRVLEAARRLLDDCAIERAPVDLVRLARHVGIGRIRELDIRLDGQLVELGDGDYEVILSRNAPHTRRRFTLAHEIGHLLVAAHENGSMSCGDGPTEELCNRVAAELLMPGRFVNAAVAAGTDTVTVRAVFPNPQRILIDGALVRVELEGDEPENVLSVPSRAISRDQVGARGIHVEACLVSDYHPAELGAGSVRADDHRVRRYAGRLEMVLGQGLRRYGEDADLAVRRQEAADHPVLHQR